MNTTRLRGLLFLLALAVVVPDLAAAQSDWVVAARKDEQITGLVDRLTPFVDQVDGADSSDGVILYAQAIVKAESDVHELCNNRIYLVRDLSAFPKRMLAPSVGDMESIDRVAAFVLRDGTIVARPEVTYEEGPEGIGRDRAVFDWSAVEPGDIIGWSFVRSGKSAYPVISMRMADVFPSIYLAASVDGGEQFAYQAKWWGIDGNDLQIKEPTKKDGRATEVKLNARARTAYADSPDQGPFPNDYPHAMLVLSEVYFEPEDGGGFLRPGWSTTTGWNQIALQGAFGIPALSEKTEGLDITLSAITTGKKTVHEKAAAITQWVRDTITQEEGDLIVDRSVREELSDVVRSKSGTETEKGLIAAIMMHQAGVPVTIASFRDPALGELDPQWASGVQITDSVLRVDDEGDVRYYAPQCETCEPGTIPPAWAGAEALVYDFDLSEKAEAFQEKRQQEAIASGAIELGRLQREVDAQDWTRFETLPGSN